jgi:hypothetical protein
VITPPALKRTLPASREGWGGVLLYLIGVRNTIFRQQTIQILNA